MIIKLKESTNGVALEEQGYAQRVNTDSGEKINILFKRENRLDDVRLLLSESDVIIIDGSSHGENEIYKMPYQNTQPTTINPDL